MKKSNLLKLIAYFLIIFLVVFSSSCDEDDPCSSVKQLSEMTLIVNTTNYEGQPINDEFSLPNACDEIVSIVDVLADTNVSSQFVFEPGLTNYEYKIETNGEFYPKFNFASISEYLDDDTPLMNYFLNPGDNIVMTLNFDENGLTDYTYTHNGEEKTGFEYLDWDDDDTDNHDNDDTPKYKHRIRYRGKFPLDVTSVGDKTSSERFAYVDLREDGIGLSAKNSQNHWIEFVYYGTVNYQKDYKHLLKWNNVECTLFINDRPYGITPDKGDVYFNMIKYDDEGNLRWVRGYANFYFDDYDDDEFPASLYFEYKLVD